MTLKKKKALKNHESQTTLIEQNGQNTVKKK